MNSKKILFRDEMKLNGIIDLENVQHSLKLALICTNAALFHDFEYIDVVLLFSYLSCEL